MNPKSTKKNTYDEKSILFSDVKKMILDADAVEAINLLIRNDKTHDISIDELNLYLYKINDLNKKERQETITTNEYNVQKNKIIISLLEQIGKDNKSTQNQNQNQTKRKSIFYLFFSLIIFIPTSVFAFFFVYHRYINNFDNDLNCIVKVSVKDSTNYNVEESIFYRLDQVIVENNYPVKIELAEENYKILNNINYKTARELGLRNNWGLIIWGRASLHKKKSDSIHVDIRYQSPTIEILRSTEENSCNIINAKYDIENGVITAGAEEAMSKVADIIMINKYLGKDRDPIDYINKKIRTRKDKKDLFHLSLRASYYLISNQLESAIKDYKTILRQDPKNAIALNNISYIYFSKNQLEKSISNLILAYEYNNLELETISQNYYSLKDEYPKKHKVLKDSILKFLAVSKKSIKKKDVHSNKQQYKHPKPKKTTTYKAITNNTDKSISKLNSEQKIDSAQIKQNKNESTITNYTKPKKNIPKISRLDYEKSDFVSIEGNSFGEKAGTINLIITQHNGVIPLTEWHYGTAIIKSWNDNRIVILKQGKLKDALSIIKEKRLLNNKLSNEGFKVDNFSRDKIKCTELTLGIVPNEQNPIKHKIDEICYK